MTIVLTPTKTKTKKKRSKFSELVFNPIVNNYNKICSNQIKPNKNNDDDDVHTSKPFTKGKNLFRSGHVKKKICRR